MLDLCDTSASNLYPVSQAINQNSTFRNKTMLGLGDVCAGGTAAAFQTEYTAVGPNGLIKALSCMCRHLHLLTSALETEWD